LLALASTLAGNLLLVGSIANLIVVEQAARLGIAIGWREHARVGVPVTAATLAIAAIWLSDATTSSAPATNMMRKPGSSRGTSSQPRAAASKPWTSDR